MQYGCVGSGEAYTGAGRSGRDRQMGACQRVWCESLVEHVGLFSCCLTPLGPGSFPLCRVEQHRLPQMFYSYLYLIALT